MNLDDYFEEIWGFSTVHNFFHAAGKMLPRVPVENVVVWVKFCRIFEDAFLKVVIYCNMTGGKWPRALKLV